MSTSAPSQHNTRIAQTTSTVGPPKPSIAATRVVNPPGAEPVLTVEQLWKDIALKAREPHLSIPEWFYGCEILKEEGNKVSLDGSYWIPRSGELISKIGGTGTRSF